MNYSLTRRQVILPEVGTVFIVKRKNSRRISIRVTPRHVQVSIPYRVNFGEGERFLFKNLDWVKSRYNELKYKFNFYDQQIINTLFGNIHINISAQGNQKNRCIREPGKIVFYFVGDIADTGFQLLIRRRVLLELRKEALKYLRVRTDELSRQYGLVYHGLRVSSALTRWGSCSARNAISLNYRLVLLPAELCDYVILHELAHTVHKNHSKAYWAFLATMVPDYEVRRRRLKQYRFSDMV